MGDREPVGLVAHPLEEVQPLGGAGEDHRVLLVGQPDLLETLGQPADRDVDHPELAHRRLGGRHLGRPAVDDDQARARRRTCAAGRSRGRPASARTRWRPRWTGLLVEQPPEPPGDHLVHGGHVVLPLDPLDHEPAVLALARQAVLEDDHARHDLGALEVGDVVALDAQRRRVEPERLLDLLQRLVAGGEVGAPLGLVHHQRLAGVAGDRLLQGALVAALGHADAHPAPPALGEQLLEDLGLGRQGRHQDLAGHGALVAAVRAGVQLQEELLDQLRGPPSSTRSATQPRWPRMRPPRT